MKTLIGIIFILSPLLLFISWLTHFYEDGFKVTMKALLITIALLAFLFVTTYLGFLLLKG
jgi:hypothetical protein